MAESGFHAVIGAVRSACTGPLASALGEANIPQISFASTAPALSNRTLFPAFFRIPPSDHHQGNLLAKLCFEFNFTHVALLIHDDLYGQGLASSFRFAFTAYNGTIVFEAIIPNTNNLDPNLAHDIMFDARASGTSVFLIFSFVEPTRRLLEEASTLGMLGTGWVYLTGDANSFANDP